MGAGRSEGRVLQRREVELSPWAWGPGLPVPGGQGGEDPWGARVSVRLAPGEGLSQARLVLPLPEGWADAARLCCPGLR